MSLPRRKPSVSLSNIPTIGEICDQLGFQGSSTKEINTFLDITHAFRKSYVASDGRAGTDFIDWNSKSIQQELTLMALKFLDEGANGKRFWSQPRGWRQEAKDLYPGDIPSIAELVKQLFLRQNRYALNNSKYLHASRAQSEDQNPRAKEGAQRLKSKPSLTIKLKHQKVAQPAKLPGKMGGSPQRVLCAKPAEVDLTRDEDENVNNTQSNEPAQTAVLNPAVEDLYEFTEDSFDQAQDKAGTESTGRFVPIDQSSLSKHRNEVESSNGDQPHKKMKTTYASGWSAPSGSKSTRANRHRRLNPVYVAGEFPSDDNHEDERTYHSRRNGRAGPRNSHNGGTSPEVQEETVARTVPNELLAEVPPVKRPFVAAVAPMIGTLPASEPEVEPLSPPALTSGEPESRDTSSPKTQLPPPAKDTLKYSVVVDYWVVTREPRHYEERWDGCKLLGKSLSSFIAEISRITQRDNIERLKLKLQTPDCDVGIIVKSDAEESWEKLKVDFKEKMMEVKNEMEARGGNHAPTLTFRIYIEPVFSRSLNEGTTRRVADDSIDF